MSIIDTLVYDRTAADTAALESLFAKAKAGSLTDEESAILYNPAHKGAYNYTDMNRVTMALEYLDGRIKNAGYASGYVPVLVNHLDGTVSTQWMEDDEDIRADKIEAYRANVERIRNALAILPSTPQAPVDMESFRWDEANDMEKILFDLDALLKSMLSVLPRAAQPLFYAGWGLYLPTAKESAEGDSYVENHVLYLAGGEVSGSTLKVSGTVSGSTLTI